MNNEQAELGLGAHCRKRKPEIGNLFMGSDKRPIASYYRSPKSGRYD